MPDRESIRRVVMTRAVAHRWLLRQATPEYRFRVFNPNAKSYPSMLRSFRDGKIAMQGVQAIPDLGVKEDFQGFYVWSSDREALQTLERWLTKRGLETTWIW